MLAVVQQSLFVAELLLSKIEKNGSSISSSLFYTAAGAGGHHSIDRSGEQFFRRVRKQLLLP